MDIFNWLNNSKLIKEYFLHDFRKSESAFYLNLKIVFVDNSILFIKDYLDLYHRKYSFHWQNPDGNLLIRWDNAPHFVDLVTFPHHKHLSTGQVVESHDISFEEILSTIKNHIENKL